MPNSQRGPLPRDIHELADYAAHDLAELAVIRAGAPRHIQPHLDHIIETMRRLTVYVDAIIDEGAETEERIQARAMDYEESLQNRADDLRGVDLGELLVLIFREHETKRRENGHSHQRRPMNGGGVGFGPGNSRARGVGFQGDGDDGRNGDGDGRAVG